MKNSSASKIADEVCKCDVLLVDLILEKHDMDEVEGIDKEAVKERQKGLIEAGQANLRRGCGR